MNNLLFSLATLGQNIVATLTGTLGGVGYEILINLIGVVAIFVKITETQNKKRSKIVFFAILGYACWILYFIFNGDFTSATVNAVGLIQSLIFLQRGKHKWADSMIWLWFFLAIQVFIASFTWKGPFSLFSICAGLISTVAYFVMSEKVYRYLFLSLILLWICNGIVYFYPIALIHDTFAAISIIIAIIRFGIKERKEKKNNENTQVFADNK